MRPITTPLFVAGVLLAGCMETSRPITTGLISGSGGAPTAKNLEAGAILSVPPSRDGVFAASAKYGEGSLLLNGCGLCEWGFLGIDLYHAALYVEERFRSREHALAGDQVVAIHLEFVRTLTQAQLRKAYTASVRVNAGDQFAAYEEDLGKLLACLDTVQAGEAYTFLTDPARGLVVQRDGKAVAEIAGDRFRKLFLRLYLGDKPPTPALRDALLGSAR